MITFSQFVRFEYKAMFSNELLTYFTHRYVTYFNASSTATNISHTLVAISFSSPTEQEALVISSSCDHGAMQLFFLEAT